MAHTGIAQMLDAGLDRAVQSAARLPHDQCAALPGPLGDLGVVADHRDRQRCRRFDHLGRHGAGEGDALLRRQGMVEPALRFVEAP